MTIDIGHATPKPLLRALAASAALFAQAPGVRPIAAAGSSIDAA